MENKIIRLTENDLHKIVKESVCKILVNEGLLSGLFGKKKETQNPQVEKRASKPCLFRKRNAVAI